MELVQGLRNKNELNLLRKALHGWNARIIYITEDISAKAMFYVEGYFLSHSIHVQDALIAATAFAHGLPLLTGNSRHFKVLKDISVIGFSPS